MRIGGLFWFIAGFAFAAVYSRDGIGAALSSAVDAIGAIVTFVLELGGSGGASTTGAGDGMVGVFAVLALIGATLLIGREWSERARGKSDADDAWERRKAHRQ